MDITNKKEEFLTQLRKSDGTYKKSINSTIRYPGGKSRAVGYIIENIPNNIEKLVSPFFGGGSVEIAVSKFLGVPVIGYDIFNVLTNYWYYQIHHPDKLADELEKLKPNKEEFEKIRLVLNDYWNKKIQLDPLTLATYYVYNFNLSYGPGFMGWSSKIYLDEIKYRKMIGKIRAFQPGPLEVHEANFLDIIKKHQDDFLYLDPPYFLGGTSKMFKGIYPMRNIPVHHNGFPHEQLASLLKEHRGGFILSYNNCDEIKELYQGYEFSYPEWQYSMGQGETRIGDNRTATQTHVKESHEILIYSAPQQAKEKQNNEYQASNKRS